MDEVMKLDTSPIPKNLEYLRVKRQNLEDEARDIKFREKKWAGSAKTEQDEVIRAYKERVMNGLHVHRVNDVRREARSSNLAYGFFMGHPYEKIERNAYFQPDWLRVAALVYGFSPYGDNYTKEKFDKWKADALKGRMKYDPWQARHTQPRSIKQPTAWSTRHLTTGVE